MRIAIDIRKIGKESTGDETYTFSLIKELAGLAEALQHNFLLLTDSDEALARKALPFLPSNFEIKQVLPASKILWTFYSLPKFLKKNPVDVLHVQYIGPFFLNRKISLVTTVHDVSFKVNPGWISRKDSFLLNSFIPPTLKRADAVVTVSHFSKGEISRLFGVDPSKIKVTYPAVSLETKSKIGRDSAKEAINKSFNFEGNYFLHISSFQPRKNVPEIITAFSAFKKMKKSDSKLILVGKRNGHNYDKLIDKALDSSEFKKDIIFTGYVANELLPDLYCGAEAFIFPSSYEGFGLPILESFINETPIVVTRDASLPEVGGNAVFYLEDRPHRSLELAEIMNQIETDKESVKKKTALGVERLSLFSWKKMAIETLRIYENLAKRTK